MDSTLGILFNGYEYFLKKFNKSGKKLIKTRLLLRKTIVMRGPEASKLFYDQSKFKRKGAVPERFKKTLFGKGGVQGLDNAAHIERKALFMNLMSQESIGKLQGYFRDTLDVYLSDWEKRSRIILFGEMEKVLTQASCMWAGIPLQEDEITLRAKQLSRMIDGSGAIGIRHYRGRWARKKTEIWIEELVKAERRQCGNAQTQVHDSILRKFSLYRNSQDMLLDQSVVAVELLNLIRPIVAIARYIIFLTQALHENPKYPDLLEKSGPNLKLAFVQEVRRFYPFFPYAAAVVKKSFFWDKTYFEEGRRVLLDLYATNRDPEIWQAPSDFKPERFRDWNGSPHDFIPQGGGDHYINHRCAGEWITINIMTDTLDFLLNKMEYNLPPQNLTIDMARIPALPKSRIIFENVEIKS